MAPQKNQGYCCEVQGGEIIPLKLPMTLLFGIFLAKSPFSPVCVRKFCTELPTVPLCAGNVTRAKHLCVEEFI